jgi:hypothetical protein
MKKAILVSILQIITFFCFAQPSNFEIKIAINSKDFANSNRYLYSLNNISNKYKTTILLSSKMSDDSLDIMDEVVKSKIIKFDVTVPKSYPLGAALTSSINKNNIIANNGLELEVFPNPTNTVLNIKLSTKNSNTDNGTITVIDAVGKIIQTYKTYEDSFAESIDTKNLSKGIYFVKYQNTNTTLSNKFIVIH